MQDTSALSAEDKELLQIAMKHAKATYQIDRSSIGAALRTKSGKIYTGRNLKFQTRGISMCAARVAMYKALDDGEEEFSTLGEVKYFQETDSYEIMNSCGECRQLFLYYPEFQEILAHQGKAILVNTHQLLPYSYA